MGVEKDREAVGAMGRLEKIAFRKEMLDGSLKDSRRGAVTDISSAPTLVPAVTPPDRGGGHANGGP